MSAAETLPWWAALAVAFLLVLGGLITVLGTLGMLRLQSFYQRIHGPAITITLGAGESRDLEVGLGELPAGVYVVRASGDAATVTRSITIAR